MKSLLVGSMCVLLSGCSMFGTDNYGTYGEMYTAHEEFDYNARSDLAHEISVVAASAEFATPVEAALFKVLAVLAISDIQKHQFAQKAPITGYDVLNTVAGGIPMAVMGLTSYGIAKKGFQYGGSTNTITGETVSISDSFDRNDTSVIGNDNTNSSPFVVGTTNTSPLMK